MWQKANIAILVCADTPDDRAALLSLGIQANVVAGKVKAVSGSDVILALRTSWLAARAALLTPKQERAWCSGELNKWKLTINRQENYLRQFLDVARLPDQTWAELTPFFDVKTFPVGVSPGLRSIGSPHPIATLKPLGWRDQVELIGRLKNGATWVELTVMIKTRIALRRMQGIVLDTVRLKMGEVLPWSECVAKYPTLTESTFLDAYTPLFVKNTRNKANIPQAFRDQLDKRIDTIRLGKSVSVTC